MFCTAFAELINLKQLIKEVYYLPYKLNKSVFAVAHVLTVGFYFGFCELFSADITFSVIVCILMAKASITV